MRWGAVSGVGVWPLVAAAPVTSLLTGSVRSEARREEAVVLPAVKKLLMVALEPRDAWVPRTLRLFLEAALDDTGSLKASLVSLGASFSSSLLSRPRSRACSSSNSWDTWEIGKIILLMHSGQTPVFGLQRSNKSEFLNGRFL